MTTEANERMERPLEAVDTQIAELLREEARRQATGLELIPSENLVSEAVLEAMGQFLRTSMRRGTRGRGITAGASTPTKWSSWRSTGRRSCLERIMPTCR